MIRDLFRRFRNSSSGYTLVEVVASVVILGIIVVPLGTAMVVGYRTVFGIQERLANSADVQRLSTYFPSDVASVDFDGVNPVRTEDEGICKAAATEQSLITFRWDADLGDNGQTVVRYLARGSGLSSEVVRRICRGSDAPVEIVMAKSFGEKGGPEASTYLTTTDDDDEELQTPVCGTRQCYVDIHGAYDFHLDAQRRVEGDTGSNSPPGAPTGVHALGGFNRARVFWDDPFDTGGLPITGYYIEQTPGGIVGGASPVFYPPESGTSGALVDGLTNNQSYTFRVRAVTIVGNGPWSDPSNAVTPGPTTPEPPTLATAAGDPNANGRVTAGWTLPPDYSDGGSALTGFNLIALNPDAIPTTVPYMNGATRNGEVTGLADNTKYKMQVTALNSYGEGSPSPVPITALTRPGAPGTPTPGSTGTAGSVMLTFTLPAGGEMSDLTNARAKVGSTFTTPVDIPTACPDQQSCTITVTGVNVGSSTNVAVQVENATGWGPESDVLVIGADTTPPTVAIAFPSNPQYGTGGWNAGCNAAGGAICGTASDTFPGGVASVSLTVRRSSDNRYWNGSAGTSNTQWPSTTVSGATTLAASGATTSSRALTTASLQNGVTYTITATARDTLNQASTPVVRTFAYVTGAPIGSLTAPANGAKVQGAAVTVSGTASATSPATVASVDFEYKASSGSTWTAIDTDSSSPYAVTWDTTALGDGSYDIRMFVIDSALNTGTSPSRTVVVDNTPPTGSITAPANGSFVRGTVSVTSNSADAGSGVANTQFQYKPTAGVTWTNVGAADASSPYSASWNTNALTEGSYDLQVITTDNVGFQFTSPVISVIVDNTNPTVGPADVAGTVGSNAWYTSDVTVTWPAPTDAGSGIASSTGCGPTTINTNTTGQTLTCSATDNAGNSASSQVTIKVDKTAPTGAIQAPASGAAVAGSVNVTSNSLDTGGSGVANATFQWSPAGADSWTQIGSPDSSSPYGVSWNTTSLAQGDYDLRVITTDNAGNTLTSPIRTVFVDSTPPTVTITFPADDGAYNATTYNAGCPTNQVCGTAADTAPGSVASVSLTIRRSSDNRWWNGSAGTGTGQWSTSATSLTVSGATAWNRVFTTVSLQNNVTYTIVATVIDAVGLTGTDTHVFVYDTTNPSGSITAPSNNGNVSGTTTITSNSTDSGGAGVASAAFEYRVNTSGPWTAIGADVAGPPWSVDWDTTALPDGQYYLRVTTTDNAGNSASSGDTSVRVRIDTTAPTGTITAPGAGATVGGGSVTVSSNSADAGSGVDSATFQRSPAGADTWTTIGTDGSSPYSVSWSTTALPGGDYDLRVITTDNAGNSFTSPVRTVFVDSIDPTVSITFPADGGAYNTAGYNAGCPTNQVCGTAADTAPGSVANVSLTIRRSSDNRWWNGSAGTGTGQWSTSATNLTASGTTSWNRVFTTASLQNGVTYTIVATATDSVGLTGTDTHAFVYDTTNPTGNVTAPANNANVSGTVNVTSNSADAGGAGVVSAEFQYRVGASGAWTTIDTATTSPFSVAWDTTSVPDGQYYLRVNTTDNAGNSFSSADTTVRPRVDNTAPTGELTAPVNGANVRGNSVTVSSSSADAGGSNVANATFQRSPAGADTWTNIGSPDTSSPYTVAWNTTSGTPDGSYDLRVVTTDGAGNSFTSATRTVLVDNTAPTALANATGTVGSNGWYVSNVAVTWTVADAGSGVASQTGCANQNVTADTTGVTFNCNVTDNAGNTTNSSTTVKRDAANPTGSLTAPADDGFVSGSAVAVSSNSTDPTSGVANATFQRSPAGANTWTTIGTPDTTPGYSVSWNTTSGTPNGNYDLRVITTDNAGNPFTSPVRTVTVDNTKPTVTSLSLTGPGGVAGNGTVGNGDQVRMVFSEPLDLSTLCTGWTSDTSNQSTNVTVTMTNSSNSDYITLPSPCSNIASGSSDNIDTNANYLSSTRTFPNSAVAYDVSTRTLTITLGTPSGSVNSSVGNAAPTFNATGSITDLAGNTLTADFTGTSSRF